MDFHIFRQELLYLILCSSTNRNALEHGSSNHCSLPRHLVPFHSRLICQAYRQNIALILIQVLLQYRITALLFNRRYFT